MHARADGETFTICALSHDRTSTHVTPTQIVSRPAERPLSDGRAAARREVRVGWVGRIEHPQSTLILCAFKAAHSETEAHLCQQWAPM